MSKMFRLPEFISFGKLRAVWSKVGNDIPLYITNPVSHVGAGGEIEYADSAPFENMKPEMTTSVELGTEWRFLNDRISFSGTYYKTNTRNQFFKLPPSRETNMLIVMSMQEISKISVGRSVPPHCRLSVKISNGNRR